MSFRPVLSTVALLTLAGAAAAFPPVTGTLDSGFYGPALWVNSVNPTGFDDNLPPASVGNPAAVIKGIEIAIPRAAIGNPTRITAMITINGGGHNFLSNQILPPVASNTPNLGNPQGDPLALPTPIPAVDFAALTGSQVTSQITLATRTNNITLPKMDGAKDTIYAQQDSVQTCYTGFGDARHAQTVGPGGSIGGSNGSELDNLSVRADANYVYFFIGGNLENNGNQLEIFIGDTAAAAVGQNVLSGLPTDTEAAGNFANLNGMTLEANFKVRHIFGVNMGNVSATDPNNDAGIFVNYAGFNSTTSTWSSYYLGSVNTLQGKGNQALATGPFLDCSLTGSVDPLFAGDPAALPPVPASSFATRNVMVAIDNGTIDGVVGQPIGSEGNPDRASGSEIDAVYGKVDGNTLYLFVAGNVESGFNKLDLFFCVNPAAGQNRLRGLSNAIYGYQGNPRIDFNGLTRMGASEASVASTFGFPTDGLKFDDGFTANYFIGYTNGGDPIQQYINAAHLRTGGRREDFTFKSLDYGAFEGGNKSNFNPINFSGRNDVGAAAGLQPISDDRNADGDLLSSIAPRQLSLQVTENSTFPLNPLPTGASNLIEGTINNSNIGGVTATTASAAASLLVTTGAEFAIDLTELGWDGISPIKVAGFINGQGHDFVSNQVFGGLPANNPNLGDPVNVDFSLIPGDQFVIIPVATAPTFCLADVAGDSLDTSYNPNGSIGSEDLDAFIAGFIADNAAIADVASDSLDTTRNPNGSVGSEDLDAFIASFISGSC